MLPYVISQDIVKYLHEIEGFSIEEIADIIDMSARNVKNTLKGYHTFSQHNLQSLIKKHDKSIISILSEACPENHLPEKLRKKIILYKHLQKVKKSRKK